MPNPQYAILFVWATACPLCIAVCIFESYLTKSIVSKKSFLGLLLISLLPIVNLAMVMVSIAGIGEYVYRRLGKNGFWDRPAFDFSRRGEKK